MKRKLTFCTLVLTSLLLVGCASKNIQGTKQSSAPDSLLPSPSTTVTPSAEQSQSHDIQNNSTAPQVISEDEAKQIALSQVPGAIEQDIQEFHSDYDNGKHHYEGKIYYGQTEYEFEIDSSSGAILEWNVEPIYCDVP